jgi:hypothetical protein
MLVQRSSNARSFERRADIERVLASVSTEFLRDIVEKMSIPRHYEAQSDNNQLTAHWIAQQFRAYGYEVEMQGLYDNVVVRPHSSPNAPCALVGAHYDSTPHTSGADDNASAVAAMLACAKAVAEHAPQADICFVSFNREEDGLLGSLDFVEHVVEPAELKVCEAHILEMVGFCDHRPGSQTVPNGLPVQIPDTGDFLGLLANKDSTDPASAILRTAKTYLPDFPVMSLKVFAGIEKFFPVLGRSDHAPFWKAGLPAVMWTDTSEFRNPHYHQETDLPATLDYDFLRSVTQLLIASVFISASS